MLLEKLQTLKIRRRVLLLLTLLGLAGSAAGNVLNARPTIAATLIALGPPVLFFASFEVASRFPVARERHWSVKVLLYFVLSCLAVLMALNSFFHQREAFHRESGDALTSWSLPIVIDLFMLVCSVLVLETEAQIRDVKAKLGVTKPPTRAEEAPVNKNEPRVTGKQKVAMALAQFPEIGLDELVRKTGLSSGYVNNLVKEIRSKGELQTA